MTGCWNEKINNNVADIENDIKTDTKINDDYVDNSLSNQGDSIIPSNNTDNVENEDSSVTQNDALSNDEVILNYFNDVTDEIDKIINSDNVINAKNKCKEYFITFVDFIFYDGKIKDITFSELTDKTKLEVIKIVEKLDNLIMSKFPNYKENISDTSKNLYDKASELLHSGKDKLEDYIIDKVGEDNYQSAIDSINEIKENDKEFIEDAKEFGSNVFQKGKEKVKGWYENFKNS